jgi:carboxyl-terminal processing protease
MEDKRMIRRHFVLRRADIKRNSRAIFVFGYVFLALFAMLSASSSPALAEAAEELPEEVVEQEEEAKPFEKEDLYYQLELFSTALSYVLHNFYNDNREFTDEDIENAINGAIRGMLQGLGDRYSFYQPKERRKREQEDLFHARFGGLGIRILPSADGFVKIVQPLDGTPAMKAGLRSGDKIIKVNDESIENKSLEEVVSVLRGEVGTDVTITIYRPGRQVPFPVTITRGIITNPSMTMTMIEGKIGYVALSRFTKETAVELEQALNKLKGEGMRSIVLDLRSNTGGLMASAVEVADAFLKEGVIVSTEGRIMRSDTQYNATNDVLCPMDMPLAILVNGNSASGSEIVAGAIKDHERGAIVGEKTFGKAVVQQRFPLDDDRAISITISIYKTPNGHWIHKQGIEPNVTVEQPEIFEGADDDMLTKLYEGEYIDKLVYEYVEKNQDQETKEQLQALEAKIPELLQTLADDEIELSEKIITWYVRRTFARVKNIPNIDLENDPQLAAAIDEVNKKLGEPVIAPDELD